MLPFIDVCIPQMYVYVPAFVNVNSKENAIMISINGIQSLLTEKKLSSFGSKRIETVKTNPDSELKIIVQK